MRITYLKDDWLSGIIFKGKMMNADEPCFDGVFSNHLYYSSNEIAKFKKQHGKDI
jgi:hypothetical protein